MKVKVVHEYAQIGATIEVPDGTQIIAVDHGEGGSFIHVYGVVEVKPRKRRKIETGPVKGANH